MRFLLFLVALLTVGCAYTNPVQPAPTPLDLSAPFSLTMGVSAGVVTARVQNANGAPLRDIVVAFSTNVGSVSPASVATGPDGRASTTLTARDTAEVIATAGSLTAHSLVAAPASPPPSAPAVVFLNVAPNGTAGKPVAFSVSSGAPGPWSWSFGDGGTATTSAFTTTHTYPQPGVYTASVSGSGTATGSAIITIASTEAL